MKPLQRSHFIMMWLTITATISAFSAILFALTDNRALSVIGAAAAFFSVVMYRAVSQSALKKIRPYVVSAPRRPRHRLAAPANKARRITG